MLITGRVYIGQRTGGTNRVVVNRGNGPLRLAERLDVRNHSPTGLEWGYAGSGPAQLSLALLCDHFNGNTVEALKFYQEFKFQIIAGIKTDRWVLTSNDIGRALEKIRGSIK